MSSESPYQLQTIGSDGKIPETRMKSAGDLRDFVVRLAQFDNERSLSRSLVDGICDGNAPYDREKLRARKQARNCNVNWGSARAYMEAASGMMYDLTSQAPGFVQVETSYGDTEAKRIEYSRIISQCADLVFSTDEEWDIDLQLSQNETTLHGNGPLMFENEYDVFPRSIETGDMLIPDRARSKTKLWEIACIRVDYYPPDLYKFIANEEAATVAGWNVPYVKKVIENAMDEKVPNSDTTYNWEWYQNEIKSKSFRYMGGSLICRLAHVFYREFDGKITHAIVQRDNSVASDGNNSDKPESNV